MDKIKCITPSWKKMQDYAKITSNKIIEEGFRPDIIIALSRGGLVPARMLCDFLVLKKCYSIKVDHWGITAAKDGKARLSQSLDVDIKGKKVLIVDDITDTGESMCISLDYIKSLGPSEVKTATLINLKDSKFKPDFFGKEQEWAWVIFPWNYMEDLVNLAGKAAEEFGEDAVKVRKELMQSCGIDIPEEDILYAFNLKDYLKNQ